MKAIIIYVIAVFVTYMFVRNSTLKDKKDRMKYSMIKQPNFEKPPRPAEDKIILKNIDLSKLTLEEEIKKFEEELKEFMDIINGNDKDTSFFHATEELFDVVQAGIGIIYLKYKKSASDVMKLYKYHLLKIKNRPRKK